MHDFISEYPFLPNAETIYPYYDPNDGQPIAYDHFDSPPSHKPLAISLKDKLWNFLNPLKLFSKPFHTKPHLGTKGFLLSNNSYSSSTFSILSFRIVYKNIIIPYIFKVTITVAILMNPIFLIVPRRKWVSRICLTLP